MLALKQTQCLGTQLKQTFLSKEVYNKLKKKYIYKPCDSGAISFLKSRIVL
jgi:hypothetical protein